MFPLLALNCFTVCSHNSKADIGVFIMSLFVCLKDRRPFVVPDSVPWRLMSNTLNLKFTSEVQTQHQLHDYNKHFLAGKIFDKLDNPDGFDNMMVSWAQFNKVCVKVCVFPCTDRLQRSHSSFNLTGGPPRSNIHFLAVVWGSNGADQETSEDLLERRVRGCLYCWFKAVTTCGVNQHLQLLLHLGWYLVSSESNTYTSYSETAPTGRSCSASVTLRLEASPLLMFALRKVSFHIWQQLFSVC